METPEMKTPEMIRRVTARRADIETARKTLKSVNQYQVPKEQIEQQSEADKMCREMRIDCEDLLNARGIVKRHRLAMQITVLTPFGKGTVLESSILNDKGEQVKLMIFSTKKNPAKSSEIVVAIGNINLNEPFLSLEKNHGNIKVLESGLGNRYGGADTNYVRRANIQDARQWKEIVDVIKEQNRTDQSSPIEHK